ncbi:DUF5590 domain-containing protein [Lactobacillus terrae]|uniref:cell wall elongation regulator TseB-like domain-containing protein n=1 Tax=Lactobacillus terrae TaxID=2269374 RepID=UPI000C1B6E5F|nr:DUF5590 domain-containing protein [Lactobacillus terrae]
MNKGTKILLSVSIIALVLISILTYLNMAISPYSSAQSQSETIAKEKAGITTSDYFGEYNRDKQYYSIGGLTQSNKYRYIIINAKSGQTTVVNKNDAPQRSEITSEVQNRYNAKKILNINLGLYKNKPTWEVSFQNKNGTIGYNLVDFETGKSIKTTNNI